MELFIDGMAHYGTAQIPVKWTVLDETGTTITIEAEGRFANCLKRVATADLGVNNSGYVSMTPLMTQSGAWTPKASGVCGFAVKCDDLTKVTSSAGQSTGNDDLFTIYEGTGAVFHVTLNTDGTMSAYYHQESALGTGYVGTSIQGLRSGAWAYVEFKWLIHSSAGSFEIRVNGVTVFTYTGRTSGSSVTHQYTNVWTTLRFLRVRGTAGLTLRMCDLYVADLEGSGDDIRDFLGDVTIYYIRPEAVGASTEWMPASGVNNWDNVEEVPPDDDVSYVSASGVGARDTYTMTDLPPGTVPIGFQTLIYAKKSAEGGASLKPVFRISGVDYDGPTQGITITDRYRYLIQPYDTNPASGLRATEDELNAAEAGQYKVV